MPEKIETTQRAYTLRIDGQGSTWRHRVWSTHLAVNRGVAAFGDWLLTLRGGLDHTLADTTDERRSDRRILLALSWLSVEVGYTGRHAIPSDRVLPEFRAILSKRGLTEVDVRDWERDCAGSLEARIKDGAVWVNRSAEFDLQSQRFGVTLTRAEAGGVIAEFFGKPSEYLALPKIHDDSEKQETAVVGGDEKFANLARGWVSKNWGSGSKSDASEIVTNLSKLSELVAGMSGKTGRGMLETAIESLGGAVDTSASLESLLDTVRKLIGWGSGRESAGRLALTAAAGKQVLSVEDIAVLRDKFAKEIEKKESTSSGPRPHWVEPIRQWIEKQTGFPYRAERDHTGEFSVMLDHAARRVSLVHSWVKLAETERSQFTKDARRMELLRNSHPAAVRWLDEFCARRSDSSNANENYRIRRRAIAGWEEVVVAWRKPRCGDQADDRISEARDLQDQLEKFGDIFLFEALADESAKIVWIEGPAVLKDYVAASDAEDKRRRFKVPAFCHAHALKHPVFCDFGNSRWEVRFAFHQARSRLKKAKKDVERRRGELERAQTRISKEEDASREKGLAKVRDCQIKLTEAEADLSWLSAPRALRMGLLEERSPKPVLLRWHSKRLAKDFALDQLVEGATKVTRADRLGRAAATSLAAESQPGLTGPVDLLGVLDEDHWNCRLQAPRNQLEQLAAALERAGLDLDCEERWDPRIKSILDRVQWFVTFSAKLQPRGPWADWSTAVGLDPSLSVWPHSELNKNRGAKARHILGRLPNLRILSVDLGHRFGAACAVWQALSSSEVQRLCGAQFPNPESSFHIIKAANSASKCSSTILRRLGPDTLDGRPHPTPWAKLERQFLIKLQGEEAEARKASPAEFGLVGDIEALLGVAQGAKIAARIPQAGGHRLAGVDELMRHAVDLLRQGIQRHGTGAKIARDLRLNRLILPGDQYSSALMSAEEKKSIRKQRLLDWHELATSRLWHDAKAQNLWAEFVESRFEFRPLEVQSEERESASVRKARGERNLKLVESVSAGLTDEACQEISIAWSKAWEAKDTAIRMCLARLRDWLRPRGIKKKGAEAFGSIRRTGGLSVRRLTTLRSFYQIQKAFFGRLRPDGKHSPPEEEFGRKSLEALDRLREQRVKQLASRIVSAALGLAPARPSLENLSSDRKEVGRLSRIRLAKLQHRFAPCHAVVTEDLENYRPDQLQTRRENRQLMQWSSSKVHKYLEEGCFLHGLQFRQVPASYTSRQDSRTGAPGRRCIDVSLGEFLKTGGFWQREAERIRKKSEENRKVGDSLVLECWDYWKKTASSPDPSQKTRIKSGSIRLMKDGGDLFVSAHESGVGSNGIQADLNAAANIGLKALLDPDWSGSWWMVPCQRVDYTPWVERVKGCPLFASGSPLRPSPEPLRMPKKEAREVVNLWRDAGCLSIYTGSWTETREYWSSVDKRVSTRLRRHNGLPEEDDLPM